MAMVACREILEEVKVSGSGRIAEPGDRRRRDGRTSNNCERTAGLSTMSIAVAHRVRPAQNTHAVSAPSAGVGAGGTAYFSAQ